MPNTHQIMIERAAPGLLRRFRVSVTDCSATRLQELDHDGRVLMTRNVNGRVAGAFHAGIIEQAVDLADALDRMAPSTQQQPASSPADPLGAHHGTGA